MPGNRLAFSGYDRGNDSTALPRRRCDNPSGQSGSDIFNPCTKRLPVADARCNRRRHGKTHRADTLKIKLPPEIERAGRGWRRRRRQSGTQRYSIAGDNGASLTAPSYANALRRRRAFYASDRLHINHKALTIRGPLDGVDAAVNRANADVAVEDRRRNLLGSPVRRDKAECRQHNAVQTPRYFGENATSNTQSASAVTPTTQPGSGLRLK